MGNCLRLMDCAWWVTRFLFPVFFLAASPYLVDPVSGRGPWVDTGPGQASSEDLARCMEILISLFPTSSSPKTWDTECKWWTCPANLCNNTGRGSSVLEMANSILQKEWLFTAIK